MISIRLPNLMIGLLLLFVPASAKAQVWIPISHGGGSITWMTPTPWSISGNAGKAGVTVTAGGKTATADASGNYTIPWLAPGAKTVTPTKAGYKFTPISQSITLGPSATGVNFTATETTPPTVSITRPIEGAWLSWTTNVIATASDNVGVTYVEFYVDGSLRFKDMTSPYDGYWFDTTKVSNGAHTVFAKAYDKAGNKKTSTTINVTVSNANPPPPPPPPVPILNFPRGATSYADDYIKNYPYNSSSGSRWQDDVFVNSREWHITSTGTFPSGLHCTPDYETCYNSAPNNVPYPVYSMTGNFNRCGPWTLGDSFCPALDEDIVYRYHPRPNIGSGIAIWMDGLTGNDTAGYDLRSVGGGFVELSDKFIVMDPLGSGPNTSCYPDACDTLQNNITAHIWGPDARKVYPGEITPDYWGIVPATDDVRDWKWQHLVANGGNLFSANPVTVKKGNGFVQVTTSQPGPTPVLDGVFGGSGGPTCIPGATKCITVYNEQGSSRSKIQQVNGEWYVTISGYMTQWDGIIRNTVDVSADLDTLAGSGTVHNTLYWTIDKMRALGIQNTANLVGHSLGAMDVVTLYQLGYGKSVVGYSVPFPTPWQAMISSGGRPATFYTAPEDLISNNWSYPCYQISTHECRVNNGVTEWLVGTGGGYWVGNNPHDRGRYQTAAGGYVW